VPAMDERMDSRIARLALARFRVGGFVGTSIADLAGALGVSKAAIYYHYRSKDALLHHLIVDDENESARLGPAEAECEARRSWEAEGGSLDEEQEP